MADTKDTINDINNIEYDIITKSKKDILDNVNFETEEDKLMCDAIISNLEKYAAIKIKDLKTVSLPIIGTIRIDPIKRIIRDNFDKFKLAKSHMNKEEYKEYAREFVNYTKDKQKELDKKKKSLNTIKAINKKKYEKYSSTLGQAYANAYIYSIYLLEELPFNEEWEEQYQRLKELE